MADTTLTVATGTRSTRAAVCLFSHTRVREASRITIITCDSTFERATNYGGNYSNLMRARTSMRPRLLDYSGPRGRNEPASSRGGGLCN